MTGKKKLVYMFEEGGRDMKDLLGGKGAGLAEMKKLGLPVPEGFTITTEACIMYQKDEKFPEGMMEAAMAALSTVEKTTGKKFGDPENPLLVSVRSGAPISMPGMMDTILNVGLNDFSVKGLIAATGNRRFALDSFRRLKQMFGNVVLGLPHDEFEHIIASHKRKSGKINDVDLNEKDIEAIIKEFDGVYKRHGFEFPQEPLEQMKMAIKAVFNSWNSERAIAYREINNIPDNLGTAVNIVSMVFGNMGNDSATGVAFTRNPNTGERQILGEYLKNAQGEDVVAGIRTPLEIWMMKDEFPSAWKEFEKCTEILEKHYRDVQDIEFTIEKGKFYLLQTRSAKRSARAEVRIAVEMAEEGVIDRKEAIMRVTPRTLDVLFHPQVKKDGTEKVLGKGLAASPGAAYGEIVFSSDRAIELAAEGRNVILVRPETTADDVRGMSKSEGFLTQKGGMTSHAAVVARAMGKPAVVGVEAMSVDTTGRTITIGDYTLREGATLTVDGTSGEFIMGKTQVEKPKADQFVDRLLQWTDEFRKLGVRANANTPDEADLARRNGGEGIGLARTERMFLGNERIDIMRAMIMSRNKEDRKRHLDSLLPMQVHDFTEFFRTMEGFPVIIRLLDPPLHEFLPDKEDTLNKLYKLKFSLLNSRDPVEMDSILQEISRETELLSVIKNLEEFNPMLGFRGCRLGISFPEIYEMQVTAIIKAAINVQEEGKKIFPEIMIPLVGTERELEVLRETLTKVAKTAMGKHEVDYKFGTMIEIPRACITADKIAKHADFFSFGTNDLTQMTFGYSRDDAEGKFMGRYLDSGILPHDPFSTVDFEGVGELMKMAVEKGRKGNKNLEVGICGEQGGDPETVEFCHKIGLDYVSASPFRIPIARLAAARAAITHGP
ncbi:MAG: pyruvate, phosphate dikinase [Cuniculiplasma sp.]